MHSKILSNFFALSPFLVFFSIFLGSGLYLSVQGQENAFYQVSASVAILPAIIYAIFIARTPLQKTIDIFLEGVREINIIMMCLVFLLAGALASILQEIGSIDSTVNFTLNFIPSQAVLPAIFLIAAVISTAMGTSMGTIAAVAPIGVGIAHASDISLAMCMGAIIGGSMFGDNLSVISDTSIAATQIHGCSAIDKFKSNFFIALPAMILTVVILTLIGTDQGKLAIPVGNYDWFLCLPYLAVLGLAVLGVNVVVVLIFGIVISGMIGILSLPSYSVFTLSKNIFDGYKSMDEILILSLLMGGFAALLKSQGAFSLISGMVERFLRSKAKTNVKLAEGAICGIASFFDICTANNTVAIILSGEAIREIAKRYNIPAARAATLVDLFSCVFQGVLPYSAQVLLAASVAGISPLMIIKNVHYCLLLGLMGVLAVVFQRPHFSLEKRLLMNT